MICLPSLFSGIFEAKAWMRRGGGGAIRESTGRDLGVHQVRPKRFRKERRQACGFRPLRWKDQRLLVSRSATLPRARGRWELPEPFVFFAK